MRSLAEATGNVSHADALGEGTVRRENPERGNPRAPLQCGARRRRERDAELRISFSRGGQRRGERRRGVDCLRRSREPAEVGNSSRSLSRRNRPGLTDGVDTARPPIEARDSNRRRPALERDGQRIGERLEEVDDRRTVRAYVLRAERPQGHFALEREGHPYLPRGRSLCTAVESTYAYEPKLVREDKRFGHHPERRRGTVGIRRERLLWRQPLSRDYGGQRNDRSAPVSRGNLDARDA